MGIILGKYDPFSDNDYYSWTPHMFSGGLG